VHDHVDAYVGSWTSPVVVDVDVDVDVDVATENAKRSRAWLLSIIRYLAS
jgi:hypothetical protein